MDDGADGVISTQEHNIINLLMVEAEDYCTGRFSKELNATLNMQTQINGNSGRDSEVDWMESSCPPPVHPVCLSEEGWVIAGEEEKCPCPTLEYWVCLDHHFTMESGHGNGAVGLSVPPVSDALLVPAPASPEVCGFIAGTGGSSHRVSGSALDPLRSTRSPTSSDQHPIRAAAHLHLLGESLSLIGHHLQETNKTVSMSSSVSLLLDSLLCALAPLMSLTTQIPELTSCTEHTLDSSLENIAFVMPGL
nr:uncharacterized protein LOC107382234 isoform X1 [Nothobranchius furzeri]